jgi:hypothetical protein
MASYIYFIGYFQFYVEIYVFKIQIAHKSTTQVSYNETFMIKILDTPRIENFLAVNY